MGNKRGGEAHITMTIDDPFSTIPSDGVRGGGNFQRKAPKDIEDRRRGKNQWTETSMGDSPRKEGGVSGRDRTAHLGRNRRGGIPGGAQIKSGLQSSPENLVPILGKAKGK